LQSNLRNAILVGVTVTAAGAAFSLALPNTTNYLFLPGMMLVYVASGGVHGYSSGVYLPSIAVWYSLGTAVNVVLYSLLAFAGLKYIHRSRN
jgi:hypothetical protein